MRTKNKTSKFKKNILQKKLILKVDNLKRTFEVGNIKTEVLKGINFEVFQGEFVGIMGPSGCGKSTTLHQLALLDKPDEGEIIIKGKKVSSFDEAQKSKFRLTELGYVFQQYRNLPELTSFENVCLPALMMGKDESEYSKEAKKLLKLVGLGNRLNHKPSELSGGQQQRVAIARALINHPAIIFADEPTASLDTAGAEVIVNLLAELNKQGQTIIMVTHEPDQAKVFDRIVWIKDGLVEKIEKKKKS